MIKRIICLAILAFFCRQIKARNNFNSLDLISSLKKLSVENNEGLCTAQYDCPFGFFCKNGDCLAKRPEGDSCLSSSDDECMCGKCITDLSTWSKICFSDTYCQNGGSTMFNSCESNLDCPDDYFCDQLNGKICTSKLAPGRICIHDSMCKCNKCEQILYETRINKPPILFNTCASC